MKGTLVNVAAIAGGSVIGMMLKSGIPERYQKIVLQGLGLTTTIIGIQMSLKTQNILILIFSLVLGALVGEKVDIERRLKSFGERVTSRLGTKYGDAGEGFIAASLLYCVGAMAVVGSIQEGMTGDASILYAKSLLDGVSAVIFGSTLGIGVTLSSISILIYQGTITMLAAQASGIFSESVMREMTAVGGALILAIGLMILEVKRLNVANLLPAIPAAALISLLWP